ncbi:unnamed protein product [Heligmosomoides polygyrus]|uniref:Collagen triple helix repeat protein n=1 Tax=Heligmosomoides polygyrus TaxID=6339 RepID=A0A183GDZ4_HELPZ|nr:unnamed protein product [Heligmosomoides polygyrus]
MSAIRTLLNRELDTFADLEQMVWTELRAEAQSVRHPRQVYDYCECEYHNDCPRGEPGRRGVPGQDGLDGVNGAPGMPGAPGILPQALYQRIDGCMICPYGPKGKPGSPGMDGPEGTPGYPGKDGHNGIPGMAGTPGEIGLPGENGKPGRDGEVFSDGIV